MPGTILSRVRRRFEGSGLGSRRVFEASFRLSVTDIKAEGLEVAGLFEVAEVACLGIAEVACLKAPGDTEIEELSPRLEDGRT